MDKHIDGINPIAGPAKKKHPPSRFLEQHFLIAWRTFCSGILHFLFLARVSIVLTVASSWAIYGLKSSFFLP